MTPMELTAVCCDAADLNAIPRTLVHMCLAVLILRFRCEQLHSTTSARMTKATDLGSGTKRTRLLTTRGARGR